MSIDAYTPPRSLLPAFGTQGELRTLAQKVAKATASKVAHDMMRA